VLIQKPRVVALLLREILRKLSFYGTLSRISDPWVQHSVQSVHIIFERREVIRLSKLAGKKLLLLGERDGIPGPAMEAALEATGAEVIFSVTECFV